ncbi:FimV/HubP family polar landmark protein, partial [Verminephrobacter aporrectodeae]
PPAVPVEDPGLLSTLMADPLLPIGAGIVLAGLLGFGAYRYRATRSSRQNRDSTQSENSSLQHDSLLGPNGAQRVDTAAGNPLTTSGSTSMAYSPSQLDAGGDVDPVAEADVYLAYGRDIQAEEILKEAVRHSPGRVSVHTKLGEIYAKRQDRKALEAVASEIFNLTHGAGPDWVHIAELGRTLDPENRLYQLGTRPNLGSESRIDAGHSGNSGHSVQGVQGPRSTLDFDLSQVPVSAALSGRAAAPVPATAAAGNQRGKLGLGSEAQVQRNQPAPQSALASGWSAQDTEPAPILNLPPQAPAAKSLQPGPSSPSMAATAAMELGKLSLDLPPARPVAAPIPAMAAGLPPASSARPASMDMPPVAPMELGKPPPAKPAAAAVSEFQVSSIGPAAMMVQDDDPLATKLALAEEFHAIGDADGARALIDEVIAESSGEVKAQAQRLLTKLMS